MDKREFIFKANGEISVRWQAQGQQQRANGTWALESSQLILNIEGINYSYNIQMPNDNTLIISDEEQGGLFQYSLSL
ncbi:hypothetical protein [Fulvivirga ligni]|uniref:hypothetical protein n=1 Tax=Fulvivirga ligni TaxID=2904246 RepID=UPI001F330EA3|nr:hypothetical protein [Fulvivirga ligni]UII21607.1 hypothetical protein LVD16_27650 [Fulvivirga ligni]